MGLLLRLTHIWPFWDKEHLGGHSIMLAIAPAGQEGPFTWMGMFLWAYRSSATDIYRVSAAMGRELGLTKPKRLLGSFSLFLSIELHEVWTCFSLHVCFSLSSHILICRVLVSAAPQFRIALALYSANTC